MKVVLKTELLMKEDIDKWNEFLKKKKDFEIGFLSDIRDLYVQSYGLKPAYYVLKSGEDMHGIFPSFRVGFFDKHLVSLPFLNLTGGFIAEKDNQKIFLKKIIELERKIGSAFIHIKTGESLNSELISDFNIKKTIFAYESVLDLKGDIKKKFDKDVKRRIKKSISVKILKVKSINEIKIYHRLLSFVHKSLHNNLTHPLKFYKNIFSILIPKKLCEIYLLSNNEKFIGGFMIFKHHKKAILADLFSLKKYSSLNPQHKALSFIINDLKKKGYSSFSFGPSFLDMDSVLSFKKSWGANHKNIYSYMIPVNKSVNLTPPSKDSFKGLRTFIPLVPYFIVKNSSGLILKRFA